MRKAVLCVCTVVEHGDGDVQLFVCVCVCVCVCVVVQRGLDQCDASTEGCESARVSSDVLNSPPGDDNDVLASKTSTPSGDPIFNSEFNDSLVTRSLVHRPRGTHLPVRAPGTRDSALGSLRVSLVTSYPGHVCAP